MLLFAITMFVKLAVEIVREYMTSNEITNVINLDEHRK